MDCDPVRVAPKASKHPAVSVPQTTSQLDLTPEKLAPVQMAVGQTRTKARKQVDNAKELKASGEG